MNKDPAWRLPHPRAANKTLSPLRLAYCGPLGMASGIYEVLQGLRLASGRGAEVRLSIAAGGDVRGLQRHCSVRGLEGLVEFHPAADAAARASLLARCHAVVLCAEDDGMRHVLLDGAPPPLPAITLCQGPVCWFVVDGLYELLVCRGDAEDFCRAVLRLADGEQWQRMAAACRQRLGS